MFVNRFLLLSSSNPFVDAYIHSDFLGKLIFIGLIACSIVSWVILIHKGWVTYQAKKYSLQFYRVFEGQKANPLGLEYDTSLKKGPNPFLEIYLSLKRHTVESLNKNRRFGNKQDTSSLSTTDIDFVDSQLDAMIANQTKQLEKNLFILATIVSLAPFLGLLGTVWGILTTFSEMQTQTAGGTHQMVLGGLSLALATTVMGLIDAIPALIGYNYLKNSIRDFETEMEGFSTEILSTVEMHYRQVDIS